MGGFLVLLNINKSLLVCLLVLAISGGSEAQRQRFECTEGSTCRSLVGYRPVNGTTIGSVQEFFGIKHLRTLLGANNLPLSTPRNYPVEAQQLIKIPIPCVCFNGTGASNKMPIYTVQPDDGLYYIATTVFGGLVEYPRIQAVNKIEDPDLIDVGQKLWIPLPCSCEDVEGQKVVHYGHVVEEGSSVEGIADEFGTTNITLYELNGIASNRQLIAGKVIDIPLRACNSSVNDDSPDYPLLVANGTYVFTANNCVRCKCDAANNRELQCEPSGLKPSNWPTCPAMQCSVGADILSLSNTTATSCGSTTCAYAGFSSIQTIFTNLIATESTCPAGTTPSVPGNYASRTSLSWEWLFVFIHPILVLCSNIL